MKLKFLFAFFLLFSVLALASSQAAVTTSLVDVSQGMGWQVIEFSASDVTYPDTVDFVLSLKNTGTVDLNVTGNLTIKKDGSSVYNASVFDDSISSQQTKNFTFNWTATGTGDFVANVTINLTSDGMGQSNVTHETTPFTVYSQPPEPPGGGSSSYTPDIPSVKITKTWDSIAPGTPETIEISNTLFAFSGITIELTRESQNVRVEVNRVFERPASVSEDPPGKTYQYVEIKHENIEEDSFKGVTIEFKVGNGWITENNISKRSVLLNRYSEGRWESFPTDFTGEDSDYKHYSSEVPGLSVFSITGQEETPCTSGEKRCVGDELQECLPGGVWETIETCGHGCLGGECVEAVCTPDERRCSEDTLQKCSADGMGWEDVETCEYGCWNNACQEMYVSFITRMAVFVMFAILAAIVVIMVVLVYMNIKTALAGRN